MQMHVSLLVLATGLAAVAGCSKETNIARSFYSEAGSEIETRDFGNATMNNTMVQSGERSYVIDLTRRFAADVPNTVKLSFFNSQLLGSEALPLSDAPLDAIADEVAAGGIPSSLAKVFAFEEIEEAHRLLDGGNAGGKVVVTI